MITKELNDKYCKILSSESSCWIPRIRTFEDLFKYVVHQHQFGERHVDELGYVRVAVNHPEFPELRGELSKIVTDEEVRKEYMEVCDDERYYGLEIFASGYGEYYEQDEFSIAILCLYVHRGYVSINSSDDPEQCLACKYHAHDVSMKDTISNGFRNRKNPYHGTLRGINRLEAFLISLY